MIETLAREVWAATGINGVQTPLMIHELVLYADNIFFVTGPGLLNESIEGFARSFCKSFWLKS